MKQTAGLGVSRREERGESSEKEAGDRLGVTTSRYLHTT